MSLDHILFRLPCHQGWSLYAWAEQNNGLTEMELVGDGYLKQDAMRRAHHRQSQNSHLPSSIF